MFKVLIVDDDEVVRFDLKRFKKWNDFNFEIASEAEDGYDALELLKEHQFDLILVDIKMPRIDGLQFLSTLRKQNKNIVVAMMSGFSDFEYAKRCIKLGANDYLLKPIDEKELCEFLESTRRHLEESKGLNNYGEYSEKQLTLINRICEYIDANIENDITLESIAEHFGYSSKHLGKIFKANKAEGFVNYITNIKMEKAKDLILSGKYKNYEISNLLGYENPDYFTIIFKKHFGLTPLGYRKSKGK